MNATPALCAKCGKPFKSVKHAGHRAGSHEFVTPTDREALVLWKAVVVETERGKRDGQVIEVESSPRAGNDFQVKVAVKRMGTTWRWASELGLI